MCAGLQREHTMKTVTLIEYLAEHGTQADLAKGLGVQQSAISQMLRAKRNITITICDDGKLEAVETRPIPARKAVA